MRDDNEERKAKFESCMSVIEEKDKESGSKASSMFKSSHSSNN